MEDSNQPESKQPPIPTPRRPPQPAPHAPSRPPLNPPPRPPPNLPNRSPSTSEPPSSPNDNKTQRNGSNSSTRELPPKYTPTVPEPIISGYLEKGSGDANPRHQPWTKKYVEVSDGTLRFFESRENRDSCVVVPLFDSFVSVQDKRYVRLENKEGVRIFRASSETRAQSWAFVIARYCSVAPTAEGFTLKLSGGKDVLEERYLRLTADGILSWYKLETDESSPKGAIQVRGEQTSINPDDKRILFVETKNRRYQFKFLDKDEATQWYTSVHWHAQRAPLAYVDSGRIRN